MSGSVRLRFSATLLAAPADSVQQQAETVALTSCVCVPTHARRRMCVLTTSSQVRNYALPGGARAEARGALNSTHLPRERAMEHHPA